MRIGVYGGTFNPVHNGHLKLARTYIEALSLDRLLVIPTRVPPHKPDDELIDGKYRLEMCRLAFAPFSNCEVSGMEMERRRKSYTVETLEALRVQYEKDKLYLLMGSDMFLTLFEWRNWQRIFEIATICVGSREPNMRFKLEEKKKVFEGEGADCKIVNLEPLVVSSTQLRTMSAEGADVSRFIPESVETYIREHGLYMSLTKKR